MTVRILPKSSVGKKILMAVTGQVMILFIILHLIGNSTLYFGWLNAYAEHLHDLPLLVWVYRIVMLILFLLHVIIGIKLYLDNRSAKPEAYAVKKRLNRTFASDTMIWSGILIAVFLMYHLLHFTVQIINPEMSSRANVDVLGRPDVLKMVILNFQDVSLIFLYTVSMVSVFLHLKHGIQSSFQSLGLNNEATLPVIIKTGTIAAIILFFGYIAIPMVILLGMVKG
jgi:succinate dehydrogenase / fumarate reductase cytochrome b subunit